VTSLHLLVKSEFETSGWARIFLHSRMHGNNCKHGEWWAMMGSQQQFLGPSSWSFQQARGIYWFHCDNIPIKPFLRLCKISVFVQGKKEFRTFWRKHNFHRSQFYNNKASYTTEHNLGNSSLLDRRFLVKKRRMFTRRLYKFWRSNAKTNKKRMWQSKSRLWTFKKAHFFAEERTGKAAITKHWILVVKNDRKIVPELRNFYDAFLRKITPFYALSRVELRVHVRRHFACST